MENDAVGGACPLSVLRTECFVDLAALDLQRRRQDGADPYRRHLTPHRLGHRRRGQNLESGYSFGFAAKA